MALYENGGVMKTSKLNATNAAKAQRLDEMVASQQRNEAFQEGVNAARAEVEQALQAQREAAIAEAQNQGYANFYNQKRAPSFLEDAGAALLSKAKGLANAFIDAAGPTQEERERNARLGAALERDMAARAAAARNEEIYQRNYRDPQVLKDYQEMIGE